MWTVTMKSGRFWFWTVERKRHFATWHTAVAWVEEHIERRRWWRCRITGPNGYAAIGGNF